MIRVRACWLKPFFVAVFLAGALIAFLPGKLNARVDRALDPSGLWENGQGSLALMLAGNALSFSYSSVFGPSAHICDGAGVAERVGPGTYHHADDGGVIAIKVTETEVRLEPVSGVPSFCGANWPGDAFKRAGHKPVEHSRVTRAKAYFFAVMPPPPTKRSAYVIAGNRVETVPLQHSQTDRYVLARFIGPKVTTAGLLERSALAGMD